MGITKVLRRIWQFSANKKKSSESFSKQPTQLVVKLNSSLRQIIDTHHIFFFYFRLIIQPTLPTNGLHYWGGDLLFSNLCSPNWCFWESCATFMARRINLIVIFDVFPWTSPAHWKKRKKKRIISETCLFTSNLLSNESSDYIRFLLLELIMDEVWTTFTSGYEG